MNRIAVRKVWVAVAAVALALRFTVANACGYDGMMFDLTVEHPRSIDVAFAVRDALDRNELHELATVPSVLGLVRAFGMLQSFRPMVTSIAEPSNLSATSIAVLLIEAGLWTRYTVTADGVVVELHVNGPLDSEPVIVTSETTLQALLNGTITPARAAELGILIVVRQA